MSSHIQWEEDDVRDKCYSMIHYDEPGQCMKMRHVKQKGKSKYRYSRVLVDKYICDCGGARMLCKLCGACLLIRTIQGDNDRMIVTHIFRCRQRIYLDRDGGFSIGYMYFNVFKLLRYHPTIIWFYIDYIGICRKVYGNEWHDELEGYRKFIEGVKLSELSCNCGYVFDSIPCGLLLDQHLYAHA